MKALPSISADKLIEGLEVFESENMVTRDPIDQMPRTESAYWRLTGADCSTVALRKPEAACSLTVLDGVGLSMVTEMVASAGIRVTNEAPFRLVIARDMLDSRLGGISKECLQNRTDWMLVRPFGRYHWIGPLFIPGKTPCWECLAWWLKVNGWSASTVIAEGAVQAKATLNLAAAHAAKWVLAGCGLPLAGRLHEFDPESLTFTQHRLLPSPNCPHCVAIATQQVDLTSTLSPIIGVTAEIQLMREWPGLVVYAGKTSQIVGASRSGRTYYCRPQETIGVAASSTDAKIVCLAEGVERYSVRYRERHDMLREAYKNLGERALHSVDITLETNDEENCAEEIIDWIPAESLLFSHMRFVPANLVYLSFDEESEVDTNGCAAGDTLRAATLSALLELIERDAVAIWWYSRACRPSIDLASFCSARIQAVLSAADSCNLHVDVLDLTTDFEIPVFVAVASGERSGIALGMAAHVDPERCAWRALTEMSAGMTTTSCTGDRQRWLERAYIEDLDHLRPTDVTRRFYALPELDTDNLLDNVLGKFRSLGLDALRVELTRPELRIPVVRMFAPGLRPLQRRLAPGRLYDVPVKLGWLSRRLTPEQMNPMSFLS